MKKFIIKIIAIVLCLFLVLSISQNCLSFQGKVDDFENGNNPIENTTEGFSKVVISVVRIVAVGIAIIMILVLGMKFMISAPSDRADIKKHLIAYVIGAFIVFGTTTILGIIIDFADTFNN